MSENEYQENLHFIVSHPEVVAREMTKRAARIAQLEAERDEAKQCWTQVSEDWRGACARIEQLEADLAHADAKGQENDKLLWGTIERMKKLEAALGEERT